MNPLGLRFALSDCHVVAKGANDRGDAQEGREYGKAAEIIRAKNPREEWRGKNGDRLS